jgi:hypothetical protein
MQPPVSRSRSVADRPLCQIDYPRHMLARPKRFVGLLLARGGERARHVQNVLITTLEYIHPPFLDDLLIKLLRAVKRLVTFT